MTHLVFRAINLLLVSWLIGSCAQPTNGFLHPSIAEHLAFRQDRLHLPLSTPRLALFSDRGLRLTLKDEASLASLRERFAGQHVVVAAVPQQSSLARELAKDPETLAFYEADAPTSTALSYALMALPDSAMVDALAAAVHSSLDHACGGLTRLNFTATQVTTTELTPPVYAEAIALPTVSAMLENVSQDKLSTVIQHLEAMGTRHHASPTGLETPQEVLSLLQTAVANAWPDAKATLIDHSSYSDPAPTKQKSIVFAIPGQDDDSSTVILGAHLDSINASGADQPAPGADDNASGVASLIETAQVLASQAARFKRRVELHFYAAEEVGLVGSRHLAQIYRQEGRHVAAMMQIDMNAYARDPSARTIHLVVNDTSASLRRSLKDLLTVYLGGDYTEASLTGGTSDHRSWTEQAFPAVFPFEAPNDYNQKIHTADDTFAAINNLALSERFVKLAIAFISHHAGLVSSEASYQSAYKSWREATPRDLLLAITAGKSSGTFRLAIAGSQHVETVEVCIIERAGSMDCTQERLTAAFGRETGARRFFAVDEDLALSLGHRLAVFAYDSEGKLMTQRSVRLDQP